MNVLAIFRVVDRRQYHHDHDPRPDDHRCKTAPGPKGTIYDPATGFAFPGNKISTSRLNQAAVNYLNAFPLPSYGTNRGKNTLQNNFYTDPVQTQRYDLGVLGAASFSLVPVALEYLCEITYPVSPEVTSTICWSGGQLLGAIFILISDKLTDGPEGGLGGTTPFNMQRALWMQAILALVVVPMPLALNCCGRRVTSRRTEVDRDDEGNVVNTNEGL